VVEGTKTFRRAVLTTGLERQAEQILLVARS
jgi:hypothetical protein